MNEKQRNEKIAEGSKTVFTYCMAKTSTREDAEDLSQDILCELIRSVGSLKDEKAFYGFMWAVAGNVYKQWCRKKRMRNTCELTEDIPAEADIYDFEEEDSERYLLRRELALLSEKYRRAIILYYVDRHSCAEIATHLHISESTVKYLLFKARKIVKEGMNMERKLGELSYNPKSLIPVYSGNGPNQFWSFMDSKLRQNIVGACYNDALTPQQISLETGIPLPYLDDEIRSLTEKKLLLCDGKRYRTNVIVITSDCSREMTSVTAAYHGKLADAIDAYISSKLTEFSAIGFYGSAYSGLSLRWMLATLIFRSIQQCDVSIEVGEAPVTAWGEHAYLYCREKEPHRPSSVFNYSTMGSKSGDGLYFLDYLPCPNGDHHDFWGNDLYTNLLCDIAKGKAEGLGEYELEAVAEMIRRGYVIKIDTSYRTAMPVYTAEQYAQARAMADAFVTDTAVPILKALHTDTVRVLSDHTPNHLQDQVAGIASVEKFTYAVEAPVLRMVEIGRLSADWCPLEMATNYIVLKP
ncbi:MAG: sigma-70 family RNA polymerase sigma factor [Clostridia bacterium]|nr:sigma-70 family RNA polymerase sigma factor [Clostridia bacterium]